MISEDIITNFKKVINYLHSNKIDLCFNRVSIYEGSNCYLYC